MGECLLDLAPYAVKGAEPPAKLLKLQNCIDKNASVELEIRATPGDSAPAVRAHLAPKDPDKDEAELRDSADSAGLGHPPAEPMVVSHVFTSPAVADAPVPVVMTEEIKTKLEMVQETKPTILAAPAMRPEEPTHEKAGSGEEVQELQRKLKWLTEEKNNLAKQKEASEKGLGEQMEQLVREKTEMFASSQKLQERVAALEKDIARMSQEKDDMQSEQNKGSNEATELAEENRLYKQKLAELQKQKADIHAQFVQASTEISSANTKAEQGRKDCEQLSSKLKSVEAEFTKTKIENENLSKALETMKGKLLEALKRVDVCRKAHARG